MAARASDISMPGVIAAKDVVGRRSAVERSVEVMNLHRDERDVRLLLNLAGSGMVLVMLLLSSLAVNLWQYYRRPDRIVVDRRTDGDHVVSFNDKPLASAGAGAVSFGPDKPGDDDKRRLANEWAAARYAIDPIAREKAVEKLLRMMEPTAANRFVSYLKGQGELERERSERWQSTWKPKVVVIDSTNPYRVNIVGTQDINKVVAGVPTHETKQVMFSLRLMPDKDAGRADHNLFTGFLVMDLLDVREVTDTGNAGESALPQQAPK